MVGHLGLELHQHFLQMLSGVLARQVAYTILKMYRSTLCASKMCDTTYEQLGVDRAQNSQAVKLSRGVVHLQAPCQDKPR
jgi:hypothetical protein